MTIDDIIATAPVIPVPVLDGSIDPASLAETLVEAGLPVFEVTLRKPSALQAVRAMATVPAQSSVPERCSMRRNCPRRWMPAHGSSFRGADRAPCPRRVRGRRAFLPGVATAGDIMRGRDLGLDRFKGVSVSLQPWSTRVYVRRI
jgi:2-dehydro-3-deoxyphosphogluconate aldolase/(4S)-4-hydroxy-2-oxoglutarate aldolase